MKQLISFCDNCIEFVANKKYIYHTACLFCYTWHAGHLQAVIIVSQENSIFDALLYLRTAISFCVDDPYCVARLRTSQMEQYTLSQKVGLGSCQLKPKRLERSKQREALLKLSRVVWILNHMNYWKRYLVQAQQAKSELSSTSVLAHDICYG